MNNSDFPIARTSGIVVQDVPNETLVYDMESDKAHCLNQTAAMVWRACDGKTSVQEIAGIIGSETGQAVHDDMIWLAIDQLNEHKLLENAVNSKFEGQSRRDVLKKMALASAVALPLVASIAAPKSVLASGSCIQTCTPTGDECVNCGVCDPDALICTGPI